MTPSDLLSELASRGVQITLAPDGAHLDLAPAEAVTQEVTELVLNNKPALLRWLAHWPAQPRPGSLAWIDWHAGRPTRQGAADGSPHQVFMARLHAALNRLARLDWTGSPGEDGARKADLELDLAAATMNGPDPEAHLAHALEALRRWERALEAVGQPRPHGGRPGAVAAEGSE